MHTHLIRSLLLISVILLSAMGYILYTNNSSFVEAFAHSGPTPTVTPPFPLYALIDSLQNQLEQVDDPEARELLEQKLVIVVEMAARQAEGAKFVATRPANPNDVKITPIILGPRPTGIIDNLSIPFSSMVLIAENGWQEKIDGNYILVVAGLLTREPKQGMVLVGIDTGKNYVWNLYLTPEKNGAVRIVSAKDNRLLLEAEDGSTIYFDVPSMSFTNAYVFAHPWQIPTETPYRPFANDIRFLQNELEQVDDPKARELLEQKLAIVARMATIQAATPEFVPTRPANPHSITTTPIMVGTKLTGIFYPSIGVSSAVYTIKNGWQEKINGNYILVAAGGLSKEPMQGLLFVEVNEGASHFWLRLLTPEKNGAVRIMSAQDNRLLLEAEDGSTIYFDVPSMSFTKSQDEILPTITPRSAQPESISTQSPPYP